MLIFSQKRKKKKKKENILEYFEIYCIFPHGIIKNKNCEFAMVLRY
jgi:hypothetical protein